MLRNGREVYANYLIFLSSSLNAVSRSRLHQLTRSSGVEKIKTTEMEILVLRFFELWISIKNHNNLCERASAARQRTKKKIRENSFVFVAGEEVFRLRNSRSISSRFFSLRRAFKSLLVRFSFSRGESNTRRWVSENGRQLRSVSQEENIKNSNHVSFTHITTRVDSCRECFSFPKKFVQFALSQPDVKKCARPSERESSKKKSLFKWQSIRDENSGESSPSQHVIICFVAVFIFNEFVSSVALTILRNLWLDPHSLKMAANNAADGEARTTTEEWR